MVMMAIMTRMQLWLNDPGNMDKLLAIKNGQQQVKLTFIIVIIMMIIRIMINMMMSIMFIMITIIDVMMTVVIIMMIIRIL